MIKVRSETSTDITLIHKVEAAAFNSSIEPTLVDMLRERQHAVLSLVAEVDEKLVGHIIYSPVILTPVGASRRGLGLGPIAVHPDYQKQGIGSALIKQGNAILADIGYDFIVLLGSPRYYTRIGFRPGSEFNLDNEYGAGDEFMAHELYPGALTGVHGLVQYVPEFKEVGAQAELTICPVMLPG